MARFAPILPDIAARITSGSAPDPRTDALGFAYALRDAVSLAKADVVVSHYDPGLEADALRGGLEADGAWADRVIGAGALAELEPVQTTVELVRTLAGLYRTGPPVTAAISGPLTVAHALADELIGADASDDDRLELCDVAADALAPLIGAYAQAGAAGVLVVETTAGWLEVPDDEALTHGPLTRALAHHRVEGVLAVPPGSELDPEGYTASAQPWAGGILAGGCSAVLVARAVWEHEPARFAEEFAPLADGVGADTLVLSDGPVPDSAPLENLHAARSALG